jgi:hypothetical protein
MAVADGATLRQSAPFVYNFHIVTLEARPGSALAWSRDRRRPGSRQRAPRVRDRPGARAVYSSRCPARCRPQRRQAEAQPRANSGTVTFNRSASATIAAMYPAQRAMSWASRLRGSSRRRVRLHRTRGTSLVPAPGRSQRRRGAYAPWRVATYRKSKSYGANNATCPYMFIGAESGEYGRRSLVPCRR